MNNSDDEEFDIISLICLWLYENDITFSLNDAFGQKVSCFDHVINRPWLYEIIINDYVIYYCESTIVVCDIFNSNYVEIALTDPNSFNRLKEIISN